MSFNKPRFCRDGFMCQLESKEHCDKMHGNKYCTTNFIGHFCRFGNSCSFIHYRNVVPRYIKLRYRNHYYEIFTEKVIQHIRMLGYQSRVCIRSNFSNDFKKCDCSYGFHLFTTIDKIIADIVKNIKLYKLQTKNTNIYDFLKWYGDGVDKSYFSKTFAEKFKQQFFSWHLRAKTRLDMKIQYNRCIREVQGYHYEKALQSHHPVIENIKSAMKKVLFVDEKAISKQVEEQHYTELQNITIFNAYAKEKVAEMRIKYGETKNLYFREASYSLQQIINKTNEVTEEDVGDLIYEAILDATDKKENIISRIRYNELKNYVSDYTHKNGIFSPLKFLGGQCIVGMMTDLKTEEDVVEYLQRETCIICYDNLVVNTAKIPICGCKTHKLCSVCYENEHIVNAVRFVCCQNKKTCTRCECAVDPSTGIPLDGKLFCDYCYYFAQRNGNIDDD